MKKKRKEIVDYLMDDFLKELRNKGFDEHAPLSKWVIMNMRFRIERLLEVTIRKNNIQI